MINSLDPNLSTVNGLVKIGDAIPDFELLDQDGNRVRSKDILGKGPIVVYFYPHDDTPGCTAEACAFRDSYEDFKDAGAEVYGVSSDDFETHRKFAEKHRLPFRLLSDRDGKVREAFGVPRSFGMLPGRVTYVMDKDGIVQYIFNSQSRVRRHVEMSLEIIRNLQKSKQKR